MVAGDSEKRLPAPRPPQPPPQTFRLRCNFRTIVTLALFALATFLLYTDQNGLFSYLKSFIRDPMTPNLSTAHKAQLQEVADELLTIYKTLVEMRYLDPEGIQPGPHLVSEELEKTWDEHGLSPSVKYLYSILPYIDTKKAGQGDFILGGQFADFRDPEEVEQGRDPFYASPEDDNFSDEDGPYMLPWVTPLSRLGNHNSVIIYDSLDHRIWIIDQIGWESTDPALKGVPEARQSSRNRMAFHHFPSRPAGEVLRDINKWYRTLHLLPGGGEEAGPEWYNEDIGLEGLYRKNGWPDNFDGDAFQSDQIRRYAAVRAKYLIEEPLRILEMDKRLLKNWNHQIETLAANVEKAETEDDKWMAEFELSNRITYKKYHEKFTEMHHQAVLKLCPLNVCQQEKHLPLWELETVQILAAQEQQDLRDKFKALNQNQSPEETDRLESAYRRQQRRATAYQNAYEASKAEADKLEEGQDSEEWKDVLARMKSVQKEADAYKLQVMEKQIAETEQWLEQVPESAVKTREYILEKLKRWKQTLEVQKIQYKWS